ncbi:MAG: hypothetical protein ACJ8J0_20725 [Longimicrobiaceae bacterium]
MSDMLTQETVDLGSGTPGEPRPDLDGELVSIPGNAAVWLITDGGYRKLVPNNATLGNLFVPNATIIQDINASNIPEEAAITDGAVLAQSTAGTVYLITNGQKWPITAGGFSRYQFASARVVTVPQVLLDSIPDGYVIRWPQP